VEAFPQNRFSFFAWFGTVEYLAAQKCHRFAQCVQPFLLENDRRQDDVRLGVLGDVYINSPVSPSPGVFFITLLICFGPKTMVTKRMADLSLAGVQKHTTNRVMFALSLKSKLHRKKVYGPGGLEDHKLLAKRLMEDVEVRSLVTKCIDTDDDVPEENSWSGYEFEVSESWTSKTPSPTSTFLSPASRTEPRSIENRQMLRLLSFPRDINTALLQPLLLFFIFYTSNLVHQNRCPTDRWFGFCASAPKPTWSRIMSQSD
jgi:hypothetical protein